MKRTIIFCLLCCTLSFESLVAGNGVPKSNTKQNGLFCAALAESVKNSNGLAFKLHLDSISDYHLTHLDSLEIACDLMLWGLSGFEDSVFTKELYEAALSKFLSDSLINAVSVQLLGKYENQVAQCYAYGNGTQEDRKKAYVWFLKSANHDNVNSMALLGGWCYLLANGCEPNPRIALEWLQKAKDFGDNSDWTNKIYNAAMKICEETKYISSENFQVKYERGIINIYDKTTLPFVHLYFINDMIGSY